MQMIRYIVYCNVNSNYKVSNIKLGKYLKNDGEDNCIGYKLSMTWQ